MQPTSSVTPSPAAGDERAFDWATLVPLLIHPTKVQIVETMQWIGRPLSAKEMERIYFGDPGLSLISYHLRQLVKVAVIEKVGYRTVRGAIESYYFLTDRFGSPAE